MCMCMLTKRTNILLEQETWKKLVKLASERKASVGELVRDAVDKTYKDEMKLGKRIRAIEATLRDRLMSKKKIDYKELINYGRKY